MNFCRKYTEERRTNELNVVYYVKTDFKKQYDKIIGRIEQQVEEEYIENLRTQCFRERSQSNCRKNCLFIKISLFLRKKV